MAGAGRPKGRTNLPIQKEYELVRLYIECGNYTKIADKTGLGRKTVSDAIKRWIDKNPEEYNKLVDMYFTRNKHQLLFMNTHTTQKALDKVDQLIDGDDMKAFKDAAIGYATLFDKGQLMKGESTSNSAVIIKLPDSLKDLAK